jgi:hypothetical protein
VLNPSDYYASGLFEARANSTDALGSDIARAKRAKFGYSLFSFFAVFAFFARGIPDFNYPLGVL